VVVCASDEGDDEAAVATCIGVTAAEVVVVAGADSSSTGKRGATASDSIGSWAAEAVEAGAGVSESAGLATAAAAVIDPRIEVDGAAGDGATGAGAGAGVVVTGCGTPFGCARLKHELHMLAVLADLKDGARAFGPGGRTEHGMRSQCEKMDTRQRWTTLCRTWFR
jgi:hypothetical protein